MNIVILGAGNVGTYLASVLSEEEHNVIVIDKNPRTLEKIAQSADVATKLGSGTDWQMLEELTDHHPHLFLALSSDNETNLVACTIAKNLGYPKTVARIKHTQYLNQSRLDFARLFFVDHLIGADRIVAHDLFRCLLHPGNLAIENFAHGQVQMRTIVIPSNWKFSGCRIEEIDFPENLLVGLIKRPASDLIFPRGQDVILSGDEVTLVGEKGTMLKLHELFNTPHKEIKSVVIAGGSSIAVQLCKLLQEQHIYAKIIEKDEEICRRLAVELPDSTVLNQDMTDFNFLLSEKINHADAFVACADSSEVNILSAALAKQAGCEEVIALVSDESYAPLLRRLGIFYSISERLSIASRILSILRADNVISISSLYNNQAKILELNVSSNSHIVGIPISDLGHFLPQDCLIAMIENRGKVMIPKGNHILSPGDTAIVICHPKHVQKLEEAF